MKAIKILSVVLAAVLLCLPLAVSAADTDSIYDGANLMTANEEAALHEKILRIEDELGVKLRIYTYHDRFETVWEDDLFSKFGLDKGDDWIALCIWSVENPSLGQDSYYYDLFTYGTADDNISDWDGDNILDHEDVFDNIKGGNTYEGCMAFTQETYQVLSVNMEPVSIWIVILISAIISLVITAVVIICILVKYKRKLKSPIYPLENYAALSLTGGNDIFIDKHVSRTRRSSSSSSSRSSGGGGRGGHRGGR